MFVAPSPMFRSRVTLAILVISMAAAEVSAAAKAFVIKRATYAGAVGEFLAEVELLADEEATMKISVPAAEADALVASIRSSSDVTITKSGGNIAVRASSPKAAKVRVSYVKKISEAFLFSYELDLGQQDNIRQYLQVADQSGATCDWQGAKLWLVLPDRNHLVTVTRKAGETQIFSSDFSVAYQILSYDPLSPKMPYYVIEGQKAFKVHVITNLCTQSLPPGDIKILQQGLMLYQTSLRNSLTAAKESGSSGGSADLLIDAVAASEIEVKSIETPNYAYEASSIKNGELQYKPTTYNAVAINNKKEHAISVKLGTKYESIPARTAYPPIALEKPSLGAEIAVNLFDLRPDKVQSNLALLGQLLVFHNEVTKFKVDAIAMELKLIDSASKQINSLNAEKANLRKLIPDLTSEGVDPSVIQRLTRRLSEVEAKINEESQKKSKATANLIPLLFA